VSYTDNEETEFSQTLHSEFEDSNTMSMNHNVHKQEEQELADHAVVYYRKEYRKSLNKCRTNAEKCELDKLLPHIRINSDEVEDVKSSQTEHDDELPKKGQNLSAQKLEFREFSRAANAIYKINDRENTFYKTLFQDIVNEENGFVNTLSATQIREWLANYECNRIRFVINQNHIHFTKFQCVSKNKLRDQVEYLGFLPKERRKKLYQSMRKYIVSRKSAFQ